MSKEIIETEWSHFITVEEIEKQQGKLIVTPDADAAKRLSNRLALLSLDSLTAELSFEMTKSTMTIHITGSFKAELTQECVVTLEPVKSVIEENFEAWFADREGAVQLAKARQDKMTEKGHTEMPMLEEFEDPESIIDGKIDLGELVTQYLSLAINPYPHAEGVEFEVGDDQGQDVKGAIDNPFAALKDWKDKLDPQS